MLVPFFNPKGVAVIGASRDPHKLGYGIVRNLVEHRYRGPVYPVNSKATEIFGFTCYKSISKVPDPVDLAIIVVPAHFVLQVLEQCGKRNIKNVIIVSGGFGETGSEGKKHEKELLSKAKEYEMRVIGPNCIGTIDTHTPVNTTFVVGMPEAGEIGFISQSGAMVAAVIDWARGAGVGFSRIVSLGNQIDVTETEMFSIMVNDPQTQVITAYIEGVNDGRLFMKEAEKAAKKKPVLVLKGGHGKSGAKAVASHTGALAGSDEAYEAAFKYSGVLRADTMEELFDWARTLAWQPLPKGNRIAVLTNAGGPAIMAVDALERVGLHISELTKETRHYLKQRLPVAASVTNPVDILAGSGPATYAVALDALLSDPTVDAALVIQAPQDWFLPASLAEVVAEVAAVHDKPVLASIMGKASVDQALTILHQRRVPNFSFPERAASAFAAMMKRKHWLETPNHEIDKFTNINPKEAEKAIEQHDFENLLESYNILQPPSYLSKDQDEAISCAKKIGYPVVLKLVSDELTHKSDVGGVILNVKNAQEVKKAYTRILKEVKKEHPQADIKGILIQKMLNEGQEIIVGAKRDPQFGPLIIVGSGGTEVELLRDIATGIAPLTPAQADQLLDQTQAGKRLKGWRNKQPADRLSVIDAMLRISKIITDHPEISEIEINPLFVLPKEQGAYAVDIRGSFNHQ
ncbi:MAG TPA: acetate--CoA ligase family protein [Balneolales bacterium]|nr:acetate--CoA ligase family protein [Balneolales bacterium]